MLLAGVRSRRPRALGHVGHLQLLIEVLGVGMGLGKASVYKYIAWLLPE